MRTWILVLIVLCGSLVATEAHARWRPFGGRVLRAAAAPVRFVRRVRPLRILRRPVQAIRRVQPLRRVVQPVRRAVQCAGGSCSVR